MTSFTGDPAFRSRHIGPDSNAVETMLKVVGHDSLDSLIDAAVPTGIQDQLLYLPSPLTEAEVWADLRRLAGENKPRD